MVQARATAPSYTRVNAVGVKLVAGVLGYLFILVIAALSLSLQRPPAPVPASAPQNEFSSARAMELVKVIAARPHPVGSAEHARVRDYLVTQLAGLGAQPEVQNASTVDERGIPYRGANVYNVLGRLRGSDNSKALMLTGHYDSVSTGPGASDDGSGVAAILEAVRALKNGPPLKNDVIVLFTDAEEVGLLGAQAFMREHPWAKDVGLVLNFEARGNEGAATMFETSNGNGWLVSEFAKAAPYPLANSLSYEIYKILPNDTDLTVFKNDGLAGMNFAFLGGVTHYHTALDNVESINEASLQHQGTHVLSLARHFGNLDLRNVSAANVVYFNPFGFTMIRYSSALILPLAILVTLLFIAVVILGFKRHLLTIGGLLLGVVSFLVSMAISYAAISAVWWLVRSLHPSYQTIIQGDVYNSGIYILAFVALSLALTSAFYFLLRRWIGLENLAMGALTVWTILMLLTSVMLPGASFMFTWPLLFSLLALGFMFFGEEEKPDSAKRVVVFSIGAIPGLLIVVPLIYLIFVGLTLGMAGAVIVIVVLLSGLLIPHLSFIPASVKWVLPGLLLAAGVVLLIAGSLTARSDRNQAQQNTIFYGLDADASKAVWATSDSAPDAWTQQFLNGANSAPLTAFFPFNSRPYLQATAPVEQLNAPLIEVVNDATNNNQRTLRLRVKSPRLAEVVTLYADADAEVASSSVNGKEIKGRYGNRPWALRYFGLPQEGIEVTLVSSKVGTPINVRVVDQSYGLPSSVQPRPENMMPAMLPFTDSTFVSKSFKF